MAAVCNDYLKPVCGASVESVKNDSISKYLVLKKLLAEAQIHFVSSKKLDGRVAVMRRSTCQCCNGKSESWYCKECVCNGDFYHSKVKVPERFAEKKIRLRRYLQRFVESDSKLENGHHRPTRRAELLEQIEHTQERIRFVTKSIEAGKEKIIKANDDRERLTKFTTYLKSSLPEFKKRLLKIQENICIYEDRIDKKRSTLEIQEKDAKDLSRQRIVQLTEFIFPVQKIVDHSKSSENEDSFDETLQMMLADAVQTHYVQGQWVRSTHFTHQENYRLVSSILPGSGHYADFSSPCSGTEDDQKKNARNICAGLTFLCQMVDILALFLGVLLPRKLTFSDFSEFSLQEMSKKKFLSLVTRLNVNVVYLCVSQGVPARALHPTKTVANLMTLLEGTEADLGRVGPFEFDGILLGGITSAGCFEDGNDSDSESEWETVNNLAPYEMRQLSNSPFLQTSGAGFQRRTGPDDSYQSGIASAAASMMSIFRGFTGTPQK